MNPPSVAVTCQSLTQMKDDASIKSFIAYFGPEDHSLYSDVHVALSKEEDNLKFVHTELSCQSDFSLTGDQPKIAVFR
jgi:hypothetical protein